MLTASNLRRRLRVPCAKRCRTANLDEGTFMAGQISGLVKAVEPAQAIVDRLMREGEELMKNLFSERGITIE